MYENVKNLENVGFSGVVASFLKGIGVAFIFTIAVFFLASLILSYTPLSEDTIPYIAFITQGAGALITGFMPAKKLRTKGLITGGISGFLYMLIMWLVASLVSDGFYFGSHMIIMFAISLLFGGIGGVVGVNSKNSNNNKKRR